MSDRDDKRTLKTIHSILNCTTIDSNIYDILMLSCFMVDAPMAFLSVIGKKDYYIKSVFGTLPGFKLYPYSSQIKKDQLCLKNPKIDSGDPLILQDASKNSEFKNNPYVINSPFLKFYVGFPIFVNNTIIGTMCVCDFESKKLDEYQLNGLYLLKNQLQNIISSKLKFSNCKPWYKRILDIF